MSLTYRTSIWFKHYNARSGKHVVPVVQRQLPDSTTWMTPSTAVFSNMDHRFALETSATTNNRFFSTEPSKGVAAATASDENEKASISNNDMVKVIAETHDLSSAQSARILATVVDTIIDSLTSKNVSVKLKGLGTFKKIVTKPRKARNFQTGGTIEVPAKQKLKFVPSSSLKENLNK